MLKYKHFSCNIQFSSQSLSCVRLFVTPWTASPQASLSITDSQSLLKLMSIKSMMPSNHLFLCHPRLFLPSILPSIKVFSNKSVFLIRSIFHRSGTFVTTDEATLTHHIHPKATVYSKIHCWYCIFCGCG